MNPDPVTNPAPETPTPHEKPKFRFTSKLTYETETAHGILQASYAESEGGPAIILRTFAPGLDEPTNRLALSVEAWRWLWKAAFVLLVGEGQAEDIAIQPGPDRIPDLERDLAEAKREKERFFWELGQIAMTIDSMGVIEGTGWSDSHKKVAELVAERERICKHVGASTLTEAFDVLCRTKTQDEDTVEGMHAKLKAQGAEIERLKAERQWQPMVSAPMDGTDILLRIKTDTDDKPWIVLASWQCRTHCFLSSLHECPNEPDCKGGWYLSACFLSDDVEPLGWMPLPSAAIDSASEGQG